MIRRISALLLTVVTVVACSAQTSRPTPCCDRKLRVVVYPFIPRFPEVLYTIKSEFEKANPDIRLELIDLSGNYYAAEKNGKPAKDYVGATDADIVELDSVFLADFVAKKRIQLLPKAAQLPDDQILKNAAAAATIDGTRYGAPHWVCGNFLFFQANDSAFQDVTNIAGLEKVVGGANHQVGHGLLVDLKGASTLGEFYLEAATDHYGWPASASHLAAIEPALQDDLMHLAQTCDRDLCRNNDYHGTEAFGRAFARRKGRALLGYSETLYQVLSETANCLKSDDCLADSDLDVRQFSLDGVGTHQVSWVDSYVISTGCVGQCLQDATEFIRFMNDDSTFKKILMPSAYSVPAYLLPAKASLYSDPEITKPAHLYPKLRTIIEIAVTPTEVGLNDELRRGGRTLDQQLPQH